MAFWNVFSGKKKTPQELMAAGNYKAALKGFQELLKTRKSDPVLFMNVADLYMKMGHRDKARSYYIKVGEYYGEQGFFNKAVAVFKKALNITPGDKEILTKLAGYNNKVPKYILDSSFLKKAGDDSDKPTGPVEERMTEPAAEEVVEPEAPVQEEVVEPEAVPEEMAAEPVFAVEPEAVAEPESEEAAPEPDLDATVETDPKLVMAETPQAHPEVSVEEEAGDYEGIDFDTLTDLTDALTEEFESTDFPLASGQRTHQEPVQNQPEPQPEEPVAEPEAAAVQDEDAGLGLAPDNIVFSTRPTEMEGDSDDVDMDFSSLDDALDSLFAADAPVQEQEQNRKHWALFRTMPEDMFMDFVIALETKDFDPGVFIVEQGNPGDEMFLIADGEVEILLDKGNGPEQVATLGGGDFFGEASLLTGAPRNATVKTITTTNCLLLRQAHLHELAKSHPSVTQSIESIYQARLRQNAGD